MIQYGQISDMNTGIRDLILIGYQRLFLGASEGICLSKAGS